MVIGSFCPWYVCVCVRCVYSVLLCTYRESELVSVEVIVTVGIWVKVGVGGVRVCVSLVVLVLV